ncbi:unnamed protein product [Closterium sp. Naga37s-1]|nr:unnamed protein product [Closterium sp. Naga37s-1]
MLVPSDQHHAASVSQLPALVLSWKKRYFEIAQSSTPLPRVPGVPSVLSVPSVPGVPGGAAAAATDRMPQDATAAAGGTPVAATRPLKTVPAGHGGHVEDGEGAGGDGRGGVVAGWSGSVGDFICTMPRLQHLMVSEPFGISTALWVPESLQPHLAASLPASISLHAFSTTNSPHLL